MNWAPAAFAVLVWASGLTAAAAEAEAAQIRVEQGREKLSVQARRPGTGQWVELAVYVTNPSLRPYFHPVRDATGAVVLTDDRPSDHPWQHGLFTGFHRVNGFNYWKEDEGRQRFSAIRDLKQERDRVSWRAFTELVDPQGHVVLEEEDAITVYAPRSDERYSIDFSFTLRAKDREVTFGKFGVGGLAVRMPWDPANPRQAHLNSNGLRGRDGEQKRAQWCLVERPFPISRQTATIPEKAGEQIFGFAILDHPRNPNHPSGWRVDEQGLINPAISMLGDWTLRANESQTFHYRVLVYTGSATADWVRSEFEGFASAAPKP